MSQRLGPTNADRHRAVLEAAAALVAERGDRVSLAEIGRRAGVARQTIYNHYRDKQGLLDAVAAEGAEPCPCCISVAGLSPERLLSRYAASLLEWAYTARQVTALRACARGLEADPETFGGRAPASQALTAVLRGEAASGRLEVADPARAADLFLDLVLRGPQVQILLGALSPPSRDHIEGLSRRAARFFVSACRARPSPFLPDTPEEQCRAASHPAPTSSPAP